VQAIHFADHFLARHGHCGRCLLALQDSRAGALRHLPARPGYPSSLSLRFSFALHATPERTWPQPVQDDFSPHDAVESRADLLQSASADEICRSAAYGGTPRALRVKCSRQLRGGLPMSIRRISFILCALVSSTALAASVAKSNPPVNANKKNDNACAFLFTLYDWQRLDNSNLIVWASRKEAYHVRLFSPLFQLNSAFSIALVDRNRDGLLCGFGTDRVVIPDRVFSERSTIAGMTRLDQAEMQRLGEQYHVNLVKKSKELVRQKGSGST
jgi:hypothetical protein